MKNLIADMIEFGFEALMEIPATKKKINTMMEQLERLVVNGEEMDAEEFIELYDTRIHDFSNKQDDIKILKRNDFEGVAIVRNCEQNHNYICASECIMRTVDRYFRGYENDEAYNEYLDGDEFTVRIFKYDESEYESIEELVNDVINYCKEEYHCESEE